MPSFVLLKQNTTVGKKFQKFQKWEKFPKFEFFPKYTNIT